MNRSGFFLAVPATLFLSSGLALAQHGHGAGGPMMAGATHGNAGMHDNSADSSATANHGASPMMASTNPGDVLDHNTHLAAKLAGLLSLSGPNALQMLKSDASGFKNFGQFMAAVHVSHNLGIPFADLETKMTGTKPISLGKAIQELKPDADAKTEVKKATDEANEDAKERS